MWRVPGWQAVLIAVLLMVVFLAWQAVFGISFEQRPSIAKCALQTAICDREFGIERDSRGGIVKAEFPISNGSALVLYQNYGTAESLLNSERAVQAREALSRFLTRNDLSRARQKKYVVIGTADLAEVQSNFDSEGVCIGKNLSSLPGLPAQVLPQHQTSNECLAYLRAFYVGEVLAELALFRDGDLFELAFDPSPFMATANERTHGELFRTLDLSAIVEELSKELGIDRQVTHSDTGSDAGLQERIRASRDGYRERFFPFRSVVVLALQCPDPNCDV
jgi:hypothetical protein